MANAKENLIKVGEIALAFIIGGGLAWWICSRLKDKAYKDLQKTHDEDTAKRLSKQFAEELKQITDLYEDIISKINKKNTEKARKAREAIINLCKKCELSKKFEKELLKKLRL